MPRSRLSAFLLSLAICGAASSPALAHAVIVESQPSPGAVVAGPDVDLRLRFNSRVDPARSRLTLTPPDGPAQTVAPAKDAPPDSLTAHLGGLASGSYRLHWDVLSVDGHVSRGDIPFRVGQ